MIYNFLFPTKPNTTKVSLFLLAVRIIFGILLMNHGIQKWSISRSYPRLFLIRSGWAVPYPSVWRSLVSWYVQWASSSAFCTAWQ